MMMTATANRSIDNLGTLAADSAMKGFVDYARQHGYEILEDNIPFICDELKIAAKAALPGAMEDARKAAEAGMMGYAMPTFVATFRLAGINVAKKWYSFE